MPGAMITDFADLRACDRRNDSMPASCPIRPFGTRPGTSLQTYARTVIPEWRSRRQVSGDRSETYVALLHALKDEVEVFAPR
jgi:hypothetical protein